MGRYSVALSLVLGTAVGLFYGYRQGNPVSAVMYGLQTTIVILGGALGVRPLPVNYPAVRSYATADRRAAWKIVRQGGIPERRLAQVVVTMAETYLKTNLPPAWLTRTAMVVAFVFGGVTLVAGVTVNAGFFLMAAFSLLLGELLLITPVTSITHRANAELAARVARTLLADTALTR